MVIRQNESYSFKLNLIYLKIDTKPGAVMAKSKAGEGLPEARGQVTKDKAVEELRNLGRDLQAIRLLVNKELGGDQNAEEWIQVGFIIDRLLFAIYVLFLSVSFITIIIMWVISYNK